MSHNLQPSMVQFGNRQIATSQARRFLTFGFARSTAGTTGVPTFSETPRTVRRIRIRQGIGRGNGNPIDYILVVNGVDTLLRVSVASTMAGESELVLPLDDIIRIPRGARIDVAVDKPSGSIQRSPIDCSITLELI